MKRALILTVGTGTRPDTNIVRPLVKTIRHSHPDFLALAVSPASRPFAEAIVQEIPLSIDRFQIVQLTAPDDIKCVFQEVNGIIRQLRDRGFEPQKGLRPLLRGRILRLI